MRLPLDEGRENKDGAEDWDGGVHAMDDCARSPKLNLRPSYWQTPRHFRPDGKQESGLNKLELSYPSSAPNVSMLEFADCFSSLENPTGLRFGDETPQPPIMMDFTSGAEAQDELPHQAEMMEPAPLDGPAEEEEDARSEDRAREEDLPADTPHTNVLEDGEEEKSPGQNFGETYQEGTRSSKFTREEDETLRLLVARYGRNWALIANSITGKNRKQVRERYENFLKKELNRGPFSPAEDALLLELIDRIGRKFYAIAEKMPGRTAIMIKNRYYNKLKNGKQRPRAQSDDIL